MSTHVDVDVLRVVVFVFTSAPVLLVVARVALCVVAVRVLCGFAQRVLALERALRCDHCTASTQLWWPSVV